MHKNRTSAKRVRENGGICTVTEESKDQAQVRLVNEGYTLVGGPKITKKKIDDGAKVYAIELNDECYIGVTEDNINTRITQHCNGLGSAKTKEMLENGADFRIVERYEPGTWTREGLLQREAEIINNTPNVINVSKNY